jgi:AraC family transcriptional regulator
VYDCFVPNAQEMPVAYRNLYESPLFRVTDFRCHAHEGGPAAEEQSESNSFALMRYGAFSKHLGKRRVTADVNQIVFFGMNSVYRISHPTDCADRGTSFLVAPQMLSDMVRELDPTIDEHPDQPFAFVTSPCDAQLFRRYRDLIQRLEGSAQQPLEHLWADVTVLQWVADVLQSAFEKQDKLTRPRRITTKTDHAERVEAAKAFLANRMSEQVMLTEVAREVAASPFNFARIFQEQTGLPVHRYLTLLRLRAALERLSYGENDLTNLALDLGFSSHSHFTDVFRREFGQTPSEVRKNATTAKFREMSKNLIV